MRVDRNSISFALAHAPDRAVANCADGRLLLTDISRAAHRSNKATLRAIKQFIEAAGGNGRQEEGGATLVLDGKALPAPETMTRTEMALAVARKIGLIKTRPEKAVQTKRAIPIKRLAAEAERTGLSVAELRPNLNPMEIVMAQGFPRGHHYRDGSHGRALTTRQEGGASHIMVATLSCAQPGCRSTGEVRLRDLPGPEIIDRKFKQQGWDVDPHKCPVCKAKPEEDKMASPSPAAVQAQARMFSLLANNFDGASGLYSNGYSDAKIAEDTGCAPELVAAVRSECFGALKVPAEIEQLAVDIRALEGLIDDALAPIRSELSALKTRVADAKKRFAA